jgi:hypothetical protein
LLVEVELNDSFVITTADFCDRPASDLGAVASFATSPVAPADDPAACTAHDPNSVVINEPPVFIIPFAHSAPASVVAFVLAVVLGILLLRH